MQEEPDGLFLFLLGRNRKDRPGLPDRSLDLVVFLLLRYFFCSSSAMHSTPLVWLNISTG